MAADDYGGEGPAILLLHGIPGTRRAWRPIAERLSGSGRVIAPDLLGFGDSSDPSGDSHAPGQAAAAAALLDAMGVRRAHLVGFDFGGPIAVALCSTHPTRALSLTLIATNVFTDTPIPGLLKLAPVPILGDALFAAMCSWPGLAAMWLGGVKDRSALPWRRFIADLPSRRGRRSTSRIFLDSLRHLTARYAPIEAALPTIACPSAVLWGESDPFFPVSVGARTAAALPGATFGLLQGCGHFIPGERPDAVAALIRRQVTRAGAARDAPTRAGAPRIRLLA